MSGATGGAAFPIADAFAADGGGSQRFEYASRGLTQLDYFAGLAMQALSREATEQGWGWDDVAHAAYRQAEAMLAEKAKREGGDAQ